MGKKKPKKIDKKKKSPLHSSLTDLFTKSPNHSYRLKRILKKLNLKTASTPLVQEQLNELVSRGTLILFSNGKYQLAESSSTITGQVDHVNRHYGYIVTNKKEEKDIYVSSSNMGLAIHGDQVRVVILSKRSGSRLEGRVVEVIQRARTQFVGRIEVSKNHGFIIPDFKRIYCHFFVPKEHLHRARTNDKVIFEVTRWHHNHKKLEAKVVDVLGQAGENEAEIHSIMAEFELPFQFPDHVLKEAKKIKKSITKDDVKQRRDFRDIRSFTIDPEDAKDFDDALSFRYLDNGNMEVGIHIADVTHYVKPHMALEENAYSRATSVYLVDRTIPMLPKQLSNDICSLNPNEDKLTFSVVFEMDQHAVILNRWFGRTIIRSDKRFTYEEAQEIINSGRGEWSSSLKALHQLSVILRKNRIKNGALEFESSEIKFDLDPFGKPIGFVQKVRQDTHKLIEEFMLLANQSVATFIQKMTEKHKKYKTFIYRTHDSPDPEKLDDFVRFASQFGYAIRLSSIAKSLNELMEKIKGKPEQNVLQSLALRAMAKAKYTTQANGHFGLAFPYYTHFTSPIRRYPDMIVHRLLQHYLNRGSSVDKKTYEEKCLHASEQEKLASHAERASVKYKQMEFMSYLPKKAMAGIIVGVTEFGLFVEIIDTKSEGLIRLTDLHDDFYEYDEKNYRLIGKRLKRIYRLGDPITVYVKKIDINRRLMELTCAPKHSTLQQNS